MAEDFSEVCKGEQKFGKLQIQWISSTLQHVYEKMYIIEENIG